MSLRYLSEPLLVFDEAQTDGRFALEFAEVAEAKKFHLRLSAAKGLENARHQGMYRSLFINRTDALVEVIDTDHPDAEKYTPSFKVVS